jgi:hypothetical protein
MIHGIQLGGWGQTDRENQAISRKAGTKPVTKKTANNQKEQFKKITRQLKRNIR